MVYVIAKPFFKFFTRDRSALTGGLAHHNAGAHRPEGYTHPRPELDAVLDLLAGTPAGNSAQRTKEAISFLETARKHHKAQPCVELLVTGPPRYEPDPTWEADSPEYRTWQADREYWTTDRIHKWANDHIAFLEGMLPSARLFSAHLHQDETSPHCHLAFIPSDESDYVSWRPLSAAAVGEKPPKDKNDKFQAAKIMSAWQDRYHEAVADKYGLERGERGSTRRHEPLTDKKRRKAMKDRIAGEILQAERKKAADQAERIADLEHENSLLTRALAVAAEFAQVTIRQAVPSFLRKGAAKVWANAAENLRKAFSRGHIAWPFAPVDEAVAGGPQENIADRRITKQVDQAATSARTEGHAAGVRDRDDPTRRETDRQLLDVGYDLGIRAQRVAAVAGVDPPADPLEAQEWLKDRPAGGAEAPVPSVGG